MNIEELVAVCAANGRRPQVISSGNTAVVAVPGMEGRLFYARNGEVISLFRREAAENISTRRTGYFNPGGDGLWPAPEGTRFGYEYAGGTWKVPAAVVSAQYDLIRRESDFLEIAAEIDLINNQQLGIPCRFIRQVQVREIDGRSVIEQHDAIEYTGRKELTGGTFSLAPWSLSQFAVDQNSVARFGDPGEPVRDLYHSSCTLLSSDGEVVTMKHDPSNRIQVALPERSRFVELILPEKNLQITRISAPLAGNLHPVDIADYPPDADPQKPVRYSIYSDPSGFMELETVGGCSDELLPGTILGVDMTNIIQAVN